MTFNRLTPTASHLDATTTARRVAAVEFFTDMLRRSLENETEANIKTSVDVLEGLTIGWAGSVPETVFDEYYALSVAYDLKKYATETDYALCMADEVK